MNYGDADQEKQAEIEVYNEMLTNLESQINESYLVKKSHEKRIQEYQKLMQEINDKVSNYV